MKDKLTVLVTTHVLPTAPSIEVIKECTDSIFNNFKGIKDCEFLVYCDSRDSEVSKEYVKNLSQLSDVKIFDRVDSGMIVNYIEVIEKCETDYLFFCEHDWLFLRPVKIQNLINCMDSNPNVNFVRFNKRNNWQTHKESGAWETYIEEETEITEFPLMRTNCIATHPHIVRKDKFVKEWLPTINRELTRTLKHHWSIELILYLWYTQEIKNLGFKKAQKKWGVFNYGPKSESNIITHLDGSNSGRT